MTIDHWKRLKLLTCFIYQYLIEETAALNVSTSRFITIVLWQQVLYQVKNRKNIGFVGVLTLWMLWFVIILYIVNTKPLVIKVIVIIVSSFCHITATCSVNRIDDFDERTSRRRFTFQNWHLRYEWAVINKLNWIISKLDVGYVFYVKSMINCHKIILSGCS